MKRILFLILLGMTLLRAHAFADGGTVTLGWSSNLHPATTDFFSSSDFTVCGSSQKTFLVTGSWTSHSSCWSNRYRITWKLFKNGTQVGSPRVATFSTTGPENFIFGLGIGGITVTPGTWTVTQTLERKPCVGSWYTAGTSVSNEIHVTESCPPPPCPANLTISGTYTTPLTEATSSITSVGATVIPTGADVRLDANDASNNGFIQLNADFETQPGSVFIAQPVDGCGPGIPAKPADNETLPAVTATDIWRAYPNPTTGIVTVQYPESVSTLYVYAVDGRLWQTFNVSANGKTELDLNALPPGMYLIRANGQNPIKVTKQ